MMLRVGRGFKSLMAHSRIVGNSRLLLRQGPPFLRFEAVGEPKGFVSVPERAELWPRCIGWQHWALANTGGDNRKVKPER
jgi:hypothetical protein